MPTTPGLQRTDGRTAATATALRRGLAHEFARYVGEAVAAVVAETREQARDAVEAIVLDLEELPAVTDARAARAEGAPAVFADTPDNVVAEMRHGDAAATEAAFARAAHRVALDVHNQRLAPSPMEPRSVVASFDEASGRIEVRISNQMPTGVAGGIAATLPDLTQPQVRVLGRRRRRRLRHEDRRLSGRPGRRLRRAGAEAPVRWQAERSEEFLSAYHGRDVAAAPSSRSTPTAGARAAREVARQRRRLRDAGGIAIQL
jgi:carbon-monoxide dehydrogenase large subunit